MKKAVAIVVVLTVVVLLGWHVYRKVSASEKGPGGPRPTVAVAVEVRPVEKTTIRDVRKLTGSLLPRSQFTVAPKVPGLLEKVFVNMGDSVQRGQLIAVLDSQEYAQQVEQARAELEVAKASVAECRSSLDVAKREFERAMALRDKKIASESELDEAEAKYKACDAKHEVSLAQVQQKAASLKEAEVRLSYTQIRASWEDGSEMRVIGERFVDEGEMLGANEPIVSVLDVSSLTAVIHVIERDYAKLRVGQAVVVTTDAHPDMEFTGTVVRIAPLLKETSRQARVDVEVPNPESLLKPGMFVRARIELDRHDGATVVPFSALVKRDGQQGVFLVERGDMKARFVPVETGILTAELAELIQPPLEGEVVTLGHHLLEDGSAVVLPGASQETKAAERASPSVSPSGMTPTGGRP